MKVLKDHTIAYTDGSADNMKTKRGGYGIYLTHNDKVKTISEACKGYTSNNKMEIKALIEVFTNVKSARFPLLIFMDSDYVYNCAIGKWKRKKNKQFWSQFEKVTKKFEESGGEYRLFVIESHVNIQRSSEVKKAYHKFLDKNDDINISYLKDQSGDRLEYIFAEVLKGNHIADAAAYQAKDKAESRIV